MLYHCCIITKLLIDPSLFCGHDVKRNTECVWPWTLFQCQAYSFHTRQREKYCIQ